MWLAPVWWPPAGRERRKNRELLSIEKEVVGYFELETPAGYQLGATTEKEDLGHKSGAAQLAQAQRSAILIERLTDELYWLCTIEDGAVFPAGDLIGSKERIEERLVEIRIDIAGKTIPFYDKSGVFQIEGALQLDFADLIGPATPAAEVICQPLRKQKFRKPVQSIVSAVLLAAVAIGGWLFYDHLADTNSQQRLRQQASRQVFEQEKIAVQQTISQHAPALMATLADTIYDRPLRAGGWKAHSYEWQKDVISVTWHREHGSINDISMHLDRHQIEFNQHANAVVEKIPFMAAVRPDDSTYEPRLDEKDDRIELMDRLTRLPGRWELEPAKITGKQYPVTRSQLSGSGGQLHQLITSAVGLQDLPLHVSRVKVSLADSFNWEVEADYFAHAE